MKRKNIDRGAINFPFSHSPAPFTRLLTAALHTDRSVFFSVRQFIVRTENAGNSLRDYTSQDEVLKIGLTTSITPCDAHVILVDARYHKPCSKHKMFFMCCEIRESDVKQTLTKTNPYKQYKSDCTDQSK